MVCQLADIFHKKVKVFEVKQKAQICKECQTKQDLAVGLIVTSADIISPDIVDQNG
jgi:hypothetical protein